MGALSRRHEYGTAQCCGSGGSGSVVVVLLQLPVVDLASCATGRPSSVVAPCGSLAGGGPTFGRPCGPTPPGCTFPFFCASEAKIHRPNGSGSHRSTSQLSRYGILTEHAYSVFSALVVKGFWVLLFL